MFEPYLQLHQIGHRAYSIAGPLSPFAITHQQTRARMIVRALLDSGYIGPGWRRGLIIVGLGPAGLVAAHEAVRQANIGRYAEVLIVDHAHELTICPAQAGCDTRWLDPTQYDWPSPRWTRAEFEEKREAFNWEAAYAHEIANRMRKEFKDFRLSDGIRDRIAIRKRSTIRTPVPQWTGRYDALRCIEEDVLTGRRQEHIAGALLYCTGLGAEDTRLPGCTSRSHRFWEIDPFEKPRLDLPTPPRVLISGGGDGGLQDFLRIATGRKSAKLVAQELFCEVGHDHSKSTSESCRFHPAFGELGLVASVEEEQLVRLTQWAEEPPKDRLSHVHRRYQLAVDKLAEDHENLWEKIKSSVIAWRKKQEWDKLHLGYSSGHFSRCFPLNHLLTLLIARALRDADESLYPLRPNHRLITCVPGSNEDHSGSGEGPHCFGPNKTHTVQFLGKPGQRWDPYTYDAVIIRHGPPPRSTRMPKLRAEMLPFSVSGA